MSRCVYCMTGFVLTLLAIFIACFTAFTLLLVDDSLHESFGSNPLNTSGNAGCAPNEQDPELGTWVAPEEVRKTCKYYLSGFDNEQRPVWIVDYGNWDLNTLLDDDELEQALEHYIQQIVYRIECSFTIKNSTVRSWVLISDLGGKSEWSTLPFAVKMARKLTRFSDTVAYGYVFNMTWVSHAFVTSAKAFLGPAINRTKLYSIDTPSSEWQSSILSQIPADQLPKQFGGITNFTPYLSFEQIPNVLIPKPSSES